MNDSVIWFIDLIVEVSANLTMRLTISRSWVALDILINEKFTQ